jgi:hypothetical protein
MSQITITWKAFGNRPEANRFVTSATVELTGKFATEIKDPTLLNVIYDATNLQSELADFGFPSTYIELWNSIEKVLPTHIQIVSQGEIVATKLIDYLNRHPEITAKLEKGGNREFYTTDQFNDFNAHAGKFYGQSVDAVRVVIP